MKRKVVQTGTVVGLVIVAIVAACAAVACDDKKTNLAPVASSLAPSTPVAPGASVKKFMIDNEASKTSIEMEAPKEKIKAVTSGGTGWIEIDLAKLTNSRGEVKMDLSTITTSTFPEAEKNKSQTTHARTWLEVGDGEDGKLDEKLKETHRYAVFAIRSVENASASDVTKITPSKDAASGDDVRTVTLTTKGELLVHGHKVDRDADVEVQFHYDAGAAPEKPKWIGIKTKKPLRVVLAEHDVKPRDGVGKIAKSSFHLLGTKVADNADIALDLRAKPQS